MGTKRPIQNGSVDVSTTGVGATSGSQIAMARCDADGGNARAWNCTLTKAGGTGNYLLTLASNVEQDTSKTIALPAINTPNGDLTPYAIVVAIETGNPGEWSIEVKDSADQTGADGPISVVVFLIN